jgi:hypothetical protein
MTVGKLERAPRRSAHQTQWAAQFAVASELCRRGYQVALTLGNHPVTDMMVVSPAGTLFRIDVKGLHSRNGWIIRRREVQPDLYYVLAYVPEPPTQCEFFVLTHAEVAAAEDAELVRLNRPKSFPVQGMPWRSAMAFRDRWEALPR